ncbi:hypothetical protein AMATHDRAFT_54171 [Amanita thiersii Skay4041]|uniref:Brain protein I3 n=1 Tax=Amanita thiersii Skay4041 TaxID=703135 RepID=A0A2A9NWE0_9AGAR|nr:hypothetical protein AMATHDRAFT_54171 [Amanita thiersii Skay4041]
MIIEPAHPDMTQVNRATQEENPPPYESSTSYKQQQGNGPTLPQPQPQQLPPRPVGRHTFQPGPTPNYNSTGQRVYEYHNPRTGEHVTSLLPPDHPEMICLQQGTHVPRARFGILGLLAAIVWFPCGIALCCLDRRVVCARCGAILSTGMCD